MRQQEREVALELNRKWLSEDHRLTRWNYVRYRAGVADLTLEQAAQAMLDPKLARDAKEYLE